MISALDSGRLKNKSKGVEELYATLEKLDSQSTAR
jgi:hypothetical protein